MIPVEAAMTNYERIIAELRSEFPKFKLVEKKNSFLMKVINIFLLVITFGKMKTFMVNFTTTIGYVVYTSTNWKDFDRVGILKHERVHMRQMCQYGWLWFAVSYLFLPLPCGLAYFRKKYEQEAYEETMRHRARKYGIEQIEYPAYRESIISNFTSAMYLWTWPFRKSIETWYDSTTANIRLELGLAATKS
jgi:hypothetical protein